MKQQGPSTRSVRLTLVVAMTATLICLVALAMGLIPSLQSSLVPAAHATGKIDVTTASDEYDTTPNGWCSLREAVESINTNTSFGGCNNPGEADTIELQALTYTLTIIGSSYEDNSKGSVAPNASMTIRGAGREQTVISAAADLNDWIFAIYSEYGVSNSINIVMEGLTVQGSPKGGIEAEFDYGAEGSSASFSDMIVQNNRGPGIGLKGYADPATFDLTNLIIRNNQNNDWGGGGLYANYGGQTNLNNVTIYDNYGRDGGGVYYGNQYGADELQMTNVTIYSNTAQYSGGGLYLANSNYGKGSLINATIAHNRVISASGGNVYNNNSVLEFTNTLVAYGTDSSGSNNCAGSPGPNITSHGYNLDSGNTCLLSASGDIINTDPLLDSALADNGGSTPTLALLAGSPAINAGTNTGCPATDQRGFPRVGICDIGAYEYALPTYLPIIFRNF